jgi:hypothetical protein
VGRLNDRTQASDQPRSDLDLLFPPLPDLEDVATPGLRGEFAGAWLADRREADLVTVSLQFVDAEHDLFLGGDCLYLLRCFRAVELEGPRLARGVLCQLGEAEVLFLMTMVVSFTLSPAKELPSSIAETKLHVPCSPSKSFLVAEFSVFIMNSNKTGSPLAHKPFHNIRATQQVTSA